MKVKLDKNSDTLYFRLDSKQIVESEEIKPGVILDFDENDNVVGIEFLRVSKRATQSSLSEVQFQMV